MYATSINSPSSEATSSKTSTTTNNHRDLKSNINNKIVKLEHRNSSGTKITTATTTTTTATPFIKSTSASSTIDSSINNNNNNNNSNNNNANNINININNNDSAQIRLNVLNRISKFLNNSSYMEYIESSSSFNQKLVQERKSRLPFLDSQTGVAQSDCCLWMTENDRLPLEKNSVGQSSSDITGKIYTYPAKRWVKRKRQYLLDDIYLRNRSSQYYHSPYLGPSTSAPQDQSMPIDHSSNDTQQLLHHSSHLQHHHNSSLSAHTRVTDTGTSQISNSNSFYNNNDSINHNHHNDSSFIHDSSSNSNACPWSINEQSKDATTSSKVDPDESTSEATVHGDFEDSNDPHHPLQIQLNPHQHHNQQLQHQQQSIQHHIQNQNHSSNNQPQLHPHQPQQSHQNTPTSSTPKRKRERKSKIEKSDDPLKPYKCDRCKMSYKTRPGLTYHRNQCHAQNNVCNSSGDDTINNDDPSNSFGTNNSRHGPNIANHTPSSAIKQAQSSSSANSANVSSNHLSGIAQSSEISDKNHRATNNTNKNGTSRATASADMLDNNDNSLYCDFCLGDTKENKKTHKPEELVSCSDCGRSAHPTCLNFGFNIILSVKKYKWQCIECKSCGLCGTSDNDDQLLFCDDCDRGYHIYCLDPPLAKPPEGLWSCSLCIEEYHSAEKQEKDIKIEKEA